MKPTVFIPLPTTDFDPTETAVPWLALKQAGIAVVFATPSGRPATADPVMLTGEGLGVFKSSMMADHHGRRAYEALTQSGELTRPRRYADLSGDEFAGILLPGGHAPGMKEYLESATLQNLIGAFFAQGKPVGAICHGVLLAARSRTPTTTLSVLFGRRTTGLPRRMELLAWSLTRLWLGDYYRTYPVSVEDEVTRLLEDPRDFVRGPFSLKRDSPDNLGSGFVLRDGNYLSARWPGDAHLFASEFLKMLTSAAPAPKR